MKGKMLLSSVFAGMICSMIFASDMDLIQNNTGLKCIRESGSPVTAMFMYNDDRCAICGDMDGNIIRITSNGYEKLKNTGLGRIDSIVLGKVSGGIACFTVQGGSLYEHNKGKTPINVSGAWGEKVKSVYKGKNSRTIYASTENGNLYMLSENGEWKESPTESEKISMGNSTEELNKNSFDSYGGIVCLSSGGSVKFAYSKDGKIYADDQYEPKPMSAKVSYVSDAVGYPEKAIYRINIEGRRLVTNDKYKLDEIFGNGYNGFKYTLSCDNDTQYDQDAYPIPGAIYNSDGSKAALQNREISFLWIGPKLKENEQRNLVVKEWAYDFSLKEENKDIPKDYKIGEVEILLPAPKETIDYSGYEVQVITRNNIPQLELYPNGVCGQPFNILIKYNGKLLEPESDIYNRLVFYALRGKGVDKNKLIGCDLLNMPGRKGNTCIAIIPGAYAEIDGYIKYGSNRDWNPIGGRMYYAYYNKKSTVDISVGLVSDGKLIGDKDDLYEIINLIAKEEKGNLEISSSLIGTNAMNNPDGRKFSLSCSSEPILGSNWKGNEHEIGAGYLDYQLTVLANVKGEQQRIFVYLPEGYNTRDLQARQDIRNVSLTVGYYCDPFPLINGNDNTDPMLALEYNVTDTTSYCWAMCNKKLYAVLFDQYGRCALKQDETDPDKAEIPGGKNPLEGKKNLWEIRDKSDNRNIYDYEYVNMKVVMQNLHKVPVIVSSNLKSVPEFEKFKYENPVKYGITKGGVFIPPYHLAKGSDAKEYNKLFTFMTEKTEWLKYEPENNSIEFCGLYGHLFNNDRKILFANFFNVSWTGLAVKLQFVQLNSDGSWQDENKPFDSSKVQSCIATNIFHPAGVVTSQMRELYFVYAPRDVIKNDIKTYNLTWNGYRYTNSPYPDIHRSVVSGSACIAKFPADENWWPNTVIQSLPSN